ncbi:LysE family translocator [Halarcobacter ebronensis]|uniref:Amino acid transporter n=1 Tax=Halarcobacter ebronensis TaxID=1462615 RepID=A0A4Q1ANS5_9BACT|nr:LysE family translocator [Halarcobacter ebronensis]QKF82442.1 transporter, LysE family [Halarcobacter ebronensis]RXK07537.1 amino acid transporter [Halarcobacter ebronensis]
MEIFTLNFFIALLIYLLGVASPGPSNLAIAHTSIYAGRKAGIVFALGITCGSFFWGILAASGLQPLLNKYSDLLYILKLLGGLYFLYLAFNSFKMAFNKQKRKSVDISKKRVSYPKYFLFGVVMHLLNPKAIAVWIAIIAVALPNESLNTGSLYVPVIACLPIGIFVFIGYSFMFSNEKVVNRYFSFKRYIDSIVGTTFSVVGLKLIFEEK